MPAQDKNILVILLVIVVIITATAFVRLYILPQSRQPQVQPTVQPQSIETPGEFRNPFEEERVNPFSEEETYQNPFEATEAGGTGYQNPFEALQ